MTDARENDGSAGAGRYHWRKKGGESVLALERPDRSIVHYALVRVGHPYASFEISRSIVASLNAFSRLTIEGIERHTPEQVEAALINADAARLRIESLEAENEKLKRFKDYVHKRLDDAGVPKDPESSHKAEGCRIGGRLDLVLVPVSPTNAQQL